MPGTEMTKAELERAVNDLQMRLAAEEEARKAQEAQAASLREQLAARPPTVGMGAPANWKYIAYPKMIFNGDDLYERYKNSDGVECSRIKGKVVRDSDEHQLLVSKGGRWSETPADFSIETHPQTVGTAA